MEMVIQIVTHTPFWVWLIFAYGIYRGIRSLTPGKVSLRTLWIMPVLFLCLSVTSLIPGVEAVPVSGLVWFAGVAAGVAAGWFLLYSRILDIDRNKARISVSGNASTLLIFIVLFGVKYFYGILNAVNHGLASQTWFVCLMLGLSGASTGIMAGRISKLYTGYFRKNAEVQTA